VRVQQKWAKKIALEEAAFKWTNPHIKGGASALARLNEITREEAAKAMNQSRYFRRCAHNLRVAIAAHRGRHPGGSGRMFGIQAWNRRRRKVARRIALEANRTFWRTV
jgi:hypothetical protein